VEKPKCISQQLTPTGHFRLLLIIESHRNVLMLTRWQ